MGGQELARNLRQQEPGRGHRHATAADAPNVADKGAWRHLSEDLAGRLRLALLCRVHGLTEAQARAVAPLAWEVAR